MVVSFFVVCPRASAAPQIEFQETEFNFGVLVQGATAQHVFAFKNAGDAALSIDNVQTSCGCTAALPGERLLPPGATSQIVVTYNSAGKMGEIHKTVVVHSNDPEKPRTQLLVKGLVTPSMHPEMTGTKNLFEGSCRTCHVDRGVGTMGRELYLADCAMCHEHHKMGGHFVARAAEELGALDKRLLKKAITAGKEGTSMPAFHKKRGGPLDSRQIESLVEYLKSTSQQLGRP